MNRAAADTASRVRPSAARIPGRVTPPVGGVAYAGEVDLVEDGVSVRGAERVRAGGFDVRRLGDGLRIHIETFAPIRSGGTPHA